MKLIEFVRERRWFPLLGISALTAEYYYDLTFVQLGLIDLGTRLVGLRADTVSMAMGLLALLTLFGAVASGVSMDRRGWSTDLYTMFRLLFGILVVRLVGLVETLRRCHSEERLYLQFVTIVVETGPYAKSHAGKRVSTEPIGPDCRCTVREFTRGVRTPGGDRSSGTNAIERLEDGMMPCSSGVVGRDGAGIGVGRQVRR